MVDRGGYHSVIRIVGKMLTSPQAGEGLCMIIGEKDLFYIKKLIFIGKNNIKLPL